MQELEQGRVVGSVIEAGCALGGSAIVLAASKTKARPMYVYDVFGTIPPPSDADGEDVLRRYEEIVAGRSKGIGGDAYYGYEENLQAKVRASFRPIRLGGQRARGASHRGAISGHYPT